MERGGAWRRELADGPGQRSSIGDCGGGCLAGWNPRSHCRGGGPANQGPGDHLPVERVPRRPHRGAASPDRVQAGAVRGQPARPVRGSLRPRTDERRERAARNLSGRRRVPRVAVARRRARPHEHAGRVVPADAWRELRSTVTRMKAESIVYAIAGMCFGIILGWIIATQQQPARAVAPVAQAAGGTQQPSQSASASGQQAKVLDEARVQQLTTILNSDPKNAVAAVQLGNTYFDAERYPEAIGWYEKAVALDPKNPDASTDLGVSYYY